MTAWKWCSTLVIPVVLFVLPSACGQEPPLDHGTIRAWDMLTEYSSTAKPTSDRVQAMAALGSMGLDPRAAHLIGEAITGKEMDVRTAAVLAAAQTKNPQLIPKLREALDDNEPQVAYAAATVLWKMHDYSGEDLLLAVVSGDAHDKLGLLKKERHKAAHDLHSPGAMTRIALVQGSGYFLGPFGFGVKAIDFIHKNGGDPGRGAAVDLLAEEHSQTIHDALVDALSEHDVAVRAAAARGLGKWPGRETAKLLQPLFDDDKAAVRLTAAAAYIRVLDPHPAPADREIAVPTSPEDGTAPSASPQPSGS
jgi:hypothetical protein